MDSAVIIGAIIGILFIMQTCLNVRYNSNLITLLDRVDTLEQLHWARTNPILGAEIEQRRNAEPEFIEDPECGTPANI
jgi:hypothetical protein